MKGKIFAAIVVIVGILLAFFIISGHGSKETAKKFMNGIYSANASKCISLMSEELVEQTMENKGLATEKIFQHNFQAELDDAVEKYKDKYGKKWKYKVHVIDEYDITGEEALYYADDAKKVEIEVNMTGKAFFRKVENVEKITVIVVKDGRNWFVEGLE